MQKISIVTQNSSLICSAANFRYEGNLKGILYFLEYFSSFITFLKFHSSDEKKLLQKQLAYILGRLQIFLEIEEDIDDLDELNEIISNSHLNNSFLALGREV